MSKENSLGHVTFAPGVCKPKVKEDGSEEPALYSGTVTIRMPDYDERMDFFEELGAATADAPQGSNEEDRAKRGARLIREAARRAGRFVVAVDLERLEDGFRLSSWEQVRINTATHAVVTEVGTRLIGRFELGKA